MKALKAILILLTALYMTTAKGQDSNRPFGFLHFRSLSGELSIENLYRMQESLFNNIEEKQNSLYFIGGIKLNLNSYLWDPQLISVRLSSEYNPESRNEKYLLVPDRSEVRTLKKLDLQTSFLSGKPVSLTAYANLNQNYYNRELLTNIKSNNRRWGGTLSLNNRVLPLSLSYRNSSWDQLETQTGRQFVMKQDIIQSVVKKSFSRHDSHEAFYSHENYNYTYSELHNTGNKLDRFRLNNNFYLNNQHSHSFNSTISYLRQAGYLQFNRIEANERLFFTLPGNLRISGRYNFHRLDNTNYLLLQHRASGHLDHKLYESLITNINIEFSSVNHDLYDETNIKAGGRIFYTKKILNHRLNISYHHYRHYMNMAGESTDVIINNEEHILSDAEITTLDKPYVAPSSIIIKDITGTIIYQQGIDYFISEINNFAEIQRIPGGLISDNQAVLVDYISVQPGSYGFGSSYNNLSASLIFFNNLLEIYYRGYSQDYINVRETEYLILNYYTRNVYGSRINLDFGNAGVEYDLYKSNIIPYERIRYYINLNKSINEKIVLTMNCNVNDYRIIDTDVNHKYYNISGRAGYNISPRSRLTLDLGYLSQKGRNIDLDLLTGRMEFQTSVRQFFLKAGIQSYMRNYLDNRYKFYGTYIELIRKF